MNTIVFMRRIPGIPWPWLPGAARRQVSRVRQCCGDDARAARRQLPRQAHQRSVGGPGDRASDQAVGSTRSINLYLRV